MYYCYNKIARVDFNYLVLARENCVPYFLCEAMFSVQNQNSVIIVKVV
jgi:hypothetical protein